MSICRPERLRCGRWPSSICPASSTSARIPRRSASSSMTSGERPTVRTARVYLLDGDLTDEQMEARQKGTCINPVESARGLPRPSPKP